MLAPTLLATLCAAEAGTPSPPPIEAVVLVTRRVAVDEARSLELASRVAARLALAGWKVPVSVPAAATRLKLSGVDPSTCEGRVDCLAELAKAFAGSVAVGVQVARAGVGTAVELTAVAPGATAVAADKSFLLRDADGPRALDEPLADFARSAAQALRARATSAPAAAEAKPAEAPKPPATADAKPTATPAKPAEAPKPPATADAKPTATPAEAPKPLPAVDAKPAAGAPGTQVAASDAKPPAPATSAAATGTTTAPSETHFALMLRLGGSAFSINSGENRVFSIMATIEGDFFVLTSVVLFLDLGLGFNFGRDVQLLATPGSLGAKYVFRMGEMLRPYAGLAVGISGIAGAFDSGQSSGGSNDSWRWLGAFGFLGGLAYYPWPTLGIGVEVRAKLAPALDQLLAGISLDAGLAWHF